MTALERIKEIEKNTPTSIPDMDERQWGESIAADGDMEFLLKAFQVMREIAIAYKQQAGCARGLEGDFDVDREFELSMKMNDEEFENRMKDEK